MGKISIANLKKTAYYLKRNGLKHTVSAVRERISGKGQEPYRFQPAAEEELSRQRALSGKGFSGKTFSIVVPAFKTPEKYLRRMIDSVLSQTYPGFELILADASGDDTVASVVRTYEDSRIVYTKLERNAGISDNTNCGISLAKGDYIGLLDHDDVLTADALFEMAAAIEEAEKKGVVPRLLYSDEDKCDGEEKTFFDPHFKEDFNLDLLLSNNYICHFLVMERGLMQELKFRNQYDGAQDFDLVLRAAFALQGKEDAIVHLPKVLYHWRCHSASTAENPQSKRYAYEAGLRATQDFARKKGWKVRAEETKHLGFYRYVYLDKPLNVREDAGAVGGPVYEKGRIAGGRMDETGRVYYENLPRTYSGYLHRAVLSQDAEALDIRNIAVREELHSLFAQVTGTEYKTDTRTGCFDISVLPEGTDFKAVSIALGRAIREKGYKLLYLPE